MAWRSYDWKEFRRDVLAPLFFCSAIGMALLFVAVFILWEFNGYLVRSLGVASALTASTYWWGRHADKMERELELKEKTKDRMGVS